MDGDNSSKKWNLDRHIWWCNCQWLQWTGEVFAEVKMDCDVTKMTKDLLNNHLQELTERWIFILSSGYSTSDIYVNTANI